ncbi:hypothetical protein FALBO_8424 [Fusarium albosuccineum]|uniref:Uncharacterized protein n=1 Tax=Fusarium albosuccineum TaxID=1237068 RepID=A0A8H4L8B3_9HYPO|nr:hypothetical protein FALBO_8424 [Fusarium albosuccineum]
MSSSKLTLTHNPRRKRDEGADEVIRKLEDYKKGNLTPRSQKLCDDLLKRAEKAQDSGDADDGLLSSSFAYFEAKQKQVEEAKRGRESAECEMASVQESLKSAEAKLESAEAELKEANKKEQDAKMALQDYELMFEFGDWFAGVLSRVRKTEDDVRCEQHAIIKKEYQHKNKVAKAEAEAKAKAEAKARGVAYRGPVDFEKVEPQAQAKAETEWHALEVRQVTDTHQWVKAEQAAVEDWRNNCGDESTVPTPDTPFLDRIELMCEKAGVTRSMCLQWIRHYSERNEISHNPPPRIRDYRKTIEKDGKVVRVEADKAEDTIDWVSMKATIDEHRADIEGRFEEGKLDKEKRDFYIELIDTYWRFLSEESDEAGNPVPTAYAKKAADDLKGKAEAKDPPETYRRPYKKGKWDDISGETD